MLEEFPGAVILRPSIVFGPEDEFFNRFAAMARISPFLPLIGGGRTRFQPVFVGDVAAAVAACLAGVARPGTVYELGGPEVLSFRELLDLTQEWTGRSRSYLRLPFWLAKLQAALTWPLPNSLRPVTYDQVRLLQHDNVVSQIGQERQAYARRPRHRRAARHRRHRAHLPRAVPPARPVRPLPRLTDGFARANGKGSGV